MTALEIANSIRDNGAFRNPKPTLLLVRKKLLAMTNWGMRYFTQDISVVSICLWPTIFPWLACSSLRYIAMHKSSPISPETVTFACLKALVSLDGLDIPLSTVRPSTPTSLSGHGITNLGNTEVGFIHATKRRKSFIVSYALCNLLYFRLPGRRSQQFEFHRTAFFQWIPKEHNRQLPATAPILSKSRCQRGKFTGASNTGVNTEGSQSESPWNTSIAGTHRSNTPKGHRPPTTGRWTWWSGRGS